MSTITLGSPYRIGIPFNTNPQIIENFNTPWIVILNNWSSSYDYTGSLTGKPEHLEVWLSCEAFDNGWEVGDEILYSLNNTVNGQEGIIGVGVNDQFIYISLPSNITSNLSYQAKPSTNDIELLSPANWRMQVRASRVVRGDLNTSNTTGDIDQAGGLVPLKSGVVNAENSLDLNLSTFFSRGYTGFKISVYDYEHSLGVQPVHSRISVDHGLTFENSLKYYSKRILDGVVEEFQDQSEIKVTGVTIASTVGGGPTSIEVTIMNPENNSYKNLIKFETITDNSVADESINHTLCLGKYDTTQPITDIQIFPGSTSDVSARYMIYGLKGFV